MPGSLATVTADFLPMIGFATSPTQRGYSYASSDDAASTAVTRRRMSNSACIVAHSAATGAASHEADLTSLDIDGFTLNWTAAAAAQTFGCVAMRL